MMLFKVCPDCRVEKPIADFSRNALRSDGLQFYCKSCYSTRSARSYRERRVRRGLRVRERPVVPPGHKYCPACRAVKPRDEWHRTKRSRDGLATQCKQCRKLSSRRDHLKRTFGITVEERAALVAQQNGVCAICAEPDPEHLDHDHATGRIRGLLCNRCNMGLGLFSDDVERLTSAIRYLRSSRVETFEPPADVIYEYAVRHHAA